MKSFDICSGYLQAKITPPLADFLPKETTIEPVSSEPKEQNPLKSAKLVFLGGRGLKRSENYLRLKAVAKKYGAVCACTRPVAMNGWESYDYFVGISGTCLENCTVVAFGVSGAGPLIKGIEKADRIIAVNTDPNALIFDYADYALIDNCMDVIKMLEEL